MEYKIQKKEKTWIADIGLAVFLEFNLAPIISIFVNVFIRTIYSKIVELPLEFAHLQLHWFFFALFHLLFSGIIIFYFVTRVKEEDCKSYLGLRRIKGVDFYEGLLGMYFLKIAISFLISWLPSLCNWFGFTFREDPGVQEAFIYRSPGHLMMLMVVVIAPIWEEIFYRGLLFKGLEKSPLGSRWAIVISAAVFAWAHLGWGGYVIAVSAFFTGLWFGWVRHKKDNLLLPICLHMLHNLVAYLFIINKTMPL